MSRAQTVRVTLLPAAGLVVAPWKNGGGVTREIARAPEHEASLDAFLWRVSVADVRADGPFSRFPGIDRTLVLLEGAGMVLDERGAEGAPEVTHALSQPLHAARFAGEAEITARLVDGATRDFNLMVRRDAVHGGLEVWRADTTRRCEAQTLLLYCAQGEAEVHVNDAAYCLAAGDTLRIDAAAMATIAAHVKGALLAVMLSETPPRAAGSANPTDKP